MRIIEIYWTEEDVEHVARHGVDPQEVGEACLEDYVLERGRAGRYVLYGRTGAGKYLKVILAALTEGGYRVVTAFEMTNAQKRQYRRNVN